MAGGGRRLGVVMVLGFASGLPLALSSGTLQAWLAVSGVDVTTIGIFSLVAVPYTVKFLWAPLMDRFVPPRLGRRRGWLALTQLGIIALLLAMAASDPLDGLARLAVLALALAFMSASQDIAFDAYRADLLQGRERGAGAGLSVAGYRLAMLVSGGLALVVGDLWGWSIAYVLMAGLMSLGLAAAWWGPEPARAVVPPPSLAAAVRDPVLEFLARPQAWAVLLLVILYKFGDAFAGTLTTTFLIRGLGFTATDVGVVNKGLGLVAVLCGALAGGLWIQRSGLFPALLAFGLLQAVTNLGFVLLASVGPNYPLMILVVAAENLAGGMGTAAFVTLLMALCDARYTATQFALLSALSALGRVLLGPPAGLLVDWLDWGPFFALTFLAALPGLAMLWVLRRTVTALGEGGGLR